MRKLWLIGLLWPIICSGQEPLESSLEDLVAFPTANISVPNITIDIPEVYTRWNPLSLDKEVECLAKNIYFESSREPEEGQFAVGLVTINRLIEGGWKNTICDIVYQKGKAHFRGRTKTVAQFSWTTAWYAKHQPKNAEAYQHDKEIAERLLANGSLYNVEDITKGATYYHAVYCHRLDKGWKDLNKVVRIGLHIFFRDKPNDEVVD